MLHDLELYGRVPFGLVAEWQTGKKKEKKEKIKVGLTPKCLIFWCIKHKTAPHFNFGSLEIALIHLEWKSACCLPF